MAANACEYDSSTSSIFFLQKSQCSKKFMTPGSSRGKNVKGNNCMYVKKNSILIYFQGDSNVMCLLTFVFLFFFLLIVYGNGDSKQN